MTSDVQLTGPGIGEQAAIPGGLPPGPVAGRSTLQLALARLRRDKVALVAGIVVLLLVALAIGAPAIAALTGHGRDQQFRTTGLSPDGFPVAPSSRFLLGTDQQGRDVLVRTLYGARVSLVVGVVATAVAALIGTTVGLIAGFVGGKTDTVLSRIIDIFLSFPFLLTALTLLTLNHDAVTGGTRHSPLLIVSGIIALFSWTYFARLVRGQVLSLREREFVEAARSLGAGPLRIMLVDVLPDLIGPVLVFVTLQIPVNVVLESTLSFLGVGVVAPTPTWGNMLSDAQSSGFYLTAPWFLLSPTVGLLITVLAFNLLGDGLRDALDPRAARTMARR